MDNNIKRGLLVGCGSLALGMAAHASPVTIDDAAAEVGRNRSPNFLVLLADDLGYSDLGGYGSEINTPNLDRVADRGVKFSNYHTSPSCAPSRAMLLTGVDNHRAGVPNIPEALPPEQREFDNYDGVLSTNVATVASLLQAEGYHTYMTGKWHLGKSDSTLPHFRGFERTLSMGDTGADNWEHRPYAPNYDDAHWYRDGEPVRLDEPFYSSELLVDEMIEYIDSNLSTGRPFFGFVSFLAVHIPVQAPKEFTDRYLDTYTDGWEALRDARHERAVEIGLVPPDTQRVTHDFVDDWDSLSDEERAFEAKRMAVYAGMAEAMDFHIGRLLDYLEEQGELDNTVIIFTSDNGPESGTATAGQMRGMGYTHEYEDLGEIGSFNFITPYFATAAASPLSLYKFYTAEGGLRVPLIVAGPGVESRSGFEHAAAHVIDITPTILSMAGVEPPDGFFGGRRVEPIIGRDLRPVLAGTADHVYGPDDYVGYEVAGNTALFNDRYKIVLNRGPLGDGEWRLYDIVSDPGETTDLRAENPAQFQHMLNLYERYTTENGVQPVPDHYVQMHEVLNQMIRNNYADQVLVWLLVALTVGVFALFRRQRTTYRN